MTTSNNAQTEKAKNYSDAQVKYLIDNAPMNWENAKKLAESEGWEGKSAASIVSKIKNLNLPYTKKVAPKKKAVQATKAELVDSIAKSIGRDLTGLDKATRAAILALGNGIAHLQHTISELSPEPVLPELGDND